MESVPVHRKDNRERNKRGMGGQKGSPGPLLRYDFLNEVIENKKGHEVEGSLSSELSSDDEAHIEKCAETLLGREVLEGKYRKSDCKAENISNLLTIISQSMDEDTETDLCRNGSGMLDVLQYRESEFDTSFLYILPIHILSEVDGVLKTIMLKFFAYMWKISLFDFPYSNNNFEYVTGTGDFGEDDGRDEDDEDTDFRSMVDSYINGDIRKFFDEIKEETSHDVEDLSSDIERLIEGYNGSMTYLVGGKKEKRVDDLFRVIRLGIRYNSKEKGLWFHSRYELEDRFGSDFEYYDSEEADLYSLFVFTWGTYEDDCIVDSILDTLNNCYCDCPKPLLNYRVLSESKNDDIEMDFPKEWEEWYNELQDLIYE